MPDTTTLLSFSPNMLGQFLHYTPLIGLKQPRTVFVQSPDNSLTPQLQDPDNADCPMYGTSPKPPKNKNTPTNPKSPKPPPRIADVEQILEESRPQHHSRPKPKAPKIPKPKLSAKEQWLENKRAELERSPLHVPNAKVIPKVPGQAPRMGATRAAEKLRGETQRGQQRHAEKGKQAKRSEGIGQVEHKEIGQVEDAPEAEPPMPK